MSARYVTTAGDVADLIMWRLTGRADGTAEALLEANPGLADHGPVLPAGLVLQLPEATEPPARTPVRLWD